MKLITVNRIIDDNGDELKVGDTVLLKTKDMYSPVSAIIDTIMTTLATFIIDDPYTGVDTITVIPANVDSIIRHERRKGF